MNKDAYFFSHDSNSKDDPKCVLLIEQLGLEGYGIFWILVETLRDQPNYKYPLSLLPAIARRYNTSAQKVESVVKSYNLFKCTDDEFFFSSSLINRMETWESSRLKKSIAGKKGNQVRWDNYREIAEQSQCDSNAITTQSQSIAMKLKETKLKETKLNNSAYTKNFEEWYSSYPNRFNKSQTYKNWLTTLKTDTYENIVKATKEYKAYIKKNRVEANYIVRSTNFIGQKQEYKGYIKEIDISAVIKPKMEIEVKPYE